MPRLAPSRLPVRFVHILLAAGACLLASVALSAETPEIPEPYRSLPGKLQARAAEFPLVPVTQGDTPARVGTILLNQRPEVFANNQAFDAVRFRTPKDPGLDLVWAFVAPQGWRHWYILPVEGTMEGFQNWLNADRAYAGFTFDSERPLTLQTLSADRLKPDTEYLIWFSQQNHVPDRDAPLQLALHFAPGKADHGDWDHEAVEQALGLVEAHATIQADFLRSRGARLLLNPDFFTADYAASRIKDCLDTRRSTQTSGGFYVTMQIIIPPCDSSPLLSEIVATHGEPNLVLPGAQRVLFEDKPDHETRATDLHYYDYFALEVNSSEPNPRVKRVVAQAFDTSAANAAIDGPTWGDVPLPGIDLRIFYIDRREVARVGHWGAPDARLISGKIPAGTYTQTYPTGELMESLTHDGKSGWDYVSHYRSGPVYRRSTLKDFRWHGLLTDYHENGRPRAELPFENGLRHGTLKQWDEAGNLLGEREFKGG